MSRRKQVSPAALLVVAALFITALGWGTDYRSCIRVNTTNHAYNRTALSEKKFLETARDSRLVLYLKAHPKPTAQQIKASKDENLAAYRVYNDLVSNIEPEKTLSCARLLPETH